MPRQNKKTPKGQSMKLLISFVPLLFCSITYASEPPNNILCDSDEITLFNCSLTKKTASLCLRKKTNQIQYRIGTAVKKELTYPKTLKDSIEKFKLSTTPYPGGGENRIRFSNGTYDYLIYDITKAQQDISGSDFLQAAGIVVYAKSKRIANFKCINSETSITSPAFEILPREDFSREFDTD